jgi:hypothetical protein
MIFHKTQYGMFGNGFAADLNGQVGTTVEDVMKLNWPETLTREMALDIAMLNMLALTAAVEKLSAWREASR